MRCTPKHQPSALYFNYAALKHTGIKTSLAARLPAATQRYGFTLGRRGEKKSWGKPPAAMPEDEPWGSEGARWDAMGSAAKAPLQRLPPCLSQEGTTATSGTVQWGDIQQIAAFIFCVGLRIDFFLHL